MNVFKIAYVILLGLWVGGCTPPGANGILGFGPERRVVVVGENVPQTIALYYQRKYDAMVWFTPPKGMVKDSTQVIFKGFGPSVAMRSLINELQSINYTVGNWEIIVPGIAEKYVLATLKNMGSGSLAHARGDFVLIDSKGNKDMEAQALRVGVGNFFVSYEFQKY